MKLYKRKKSKYWQFKFTLSGQPKPYRGSTGEVNLDRADKIAALKFAAAFENRDPLARKSSTLDKVVVDRFNPWLRDVRLNPNSKRYYESGVRLLEATGIWKMRLDAIDRDAVETLKIPGAAANVNCALRTLSRILHKSEDWKLIRGTPKIKLLAEHGRDLQLDDLAEKALLAGADLCNWKPPALVRFQDVVAMARETGTRDVKELLEMRIENLDWERRKIKIPDSKTPSGVRYVPMNNRAFEVLKRLCGDLREGWVFPSPTKRSKSGHLGSISKQFCEARRKAGLPEELVLYCARHDFGTRLFGETKDLKLVMDLMGQVDYKSALRYQHPDIDRARAALDREATS